jgi:hypothetical protein
MNPYNLVRVAFLATLVIFLYSSVTAQVQIQQVPSGSLQLSVLDAASINIIVAQPSVNTSISLVAEVFDQNRKLAQIAISNLHLQSGINVVNAAFVSDKNIIYYDENIRLHQSIYGCLPPGQYRFCVEIKCASPACHDVLIDKQYKSCNTFNSQLKQPVLLTSPADKDIISETQPTLTWVPVLPGLNSFISYSAKLVEIKNGQEPSAAILINAPVLLFDNIQSNVLPFPSTVKPLEEGKKYAWVITAYTEASKLYGISETWVFSVKNEKKEAPAGVTIKLLPELSAGYVEIADKTFSIEFEERYVSGKMKCAIYNAKGEKIDFDLRELVDSSGNVIPGKESVGKEAEKRHGTNKYLVDMRKYKIPSGFYVLEAVNEKDEKFYLRFKTQ